MTAERVGNADTLDVRIAVMSLLWGNPHGEALIPWLQDVRAAGYEGISGFAHLGWQRYLDEPTSFKSVLDDHGLPLASLLASAENDLDEFRRVCAFMAAVDCRILVCNGGIGGVAASYGEMGERMNRIGEIALEHGVRAHYHNGRARETLEDMDELIERTDPEKVFVMCDLGHATRDFVNQPVEKRAMAFLRRYADRLDFVEFKDWHPETDLNTPLGEGLCDYPSVFAFLREQKYTGWIVVEQNGGSKLSRGREPIECARISREFVHQGLGV
ncbi:MAG TPA: sugar phosphate isomerase/epimerase family protein [Chloroflexota bacterium]|nr:sugar phosphate isomerase/epimerase family protein [Chloroflexota bacterium]